MTGQGEPSGGAGPSQLILASASTVRAALLRNAGIAFRVEPAQISEAEIKQAAAHAEPADLALALAKAKALDTASRHPGALVIGADQLLVLDGRIFDKPGTQAEARRQLNALRGSAHQLISAFALARGGQILAAHDQSARLTMRAFSDSVLDDYMKEAGDALLTSVGAYQVEGPGIRLFESIEGDYFTILGLPLLALLDQLRKLEIIGS
jgi:septum formation protein